MTAAKRVLHDHKSGADFQLHVNGNGIGIVIGIGIKISNSLIEYSESNWANDGAECNFQGGHVFLARNGATLWQSQKQRVITMSTLIVEFIACSVASSEEH